MTEGKQFEQDFKNSIPKHYWSYRFKDGTANWDNGDKSNTRFQHKNICDTLIFVIQTLFLLELKSTKSKSLPFSMIRDNQIKELDEASKFKGIVAGLVVNFRSVNETYFLPITGLKYYMDTLDSKYIPLSIFRENCYQIHQVQLKVHFRYDIEMFVEKNKC